MKNFKIFLPTILLLCAFCMKDSPSQVGDILVNGNWMQFEYLTDEDNDGIFTDNSLPCQFADVWKFTLDNKFELRDEIEYCNTDVDSIAIIPGRWELRNNDTELYVEIDPEFLFFNFQIHSISDTLLELRQYNTPGSQAPPEERFILRR